MSSPHDPDAHNARLISRAEGYGGGPNVAVNAVACHVEALGSVPCFSIIIKEYVDSVDISMYLF